METHNFMGVPLSIFKKFDFKKIKGDWEVFGSFVYSRKMNDFIADDYQVNIKVPLPHIYKVHEEKNKTEVIRSYYYW